MYSLSPLATAYGAAPITGTIRATPEDFQVIEIPAFSPSGDGEHCIVHIRKKLMNTAHVAKLLARHANLPQSRVSWAGMKDRNAVTEQWFSVHLANKPEPDWSALNDDKIKVLDVYRHQRKLKKGVLKGNQFYLRITDVKGDIDALKARYETILDHGVPNYFGEQRFGFRGRNLHKALAMFRKPQRRMPRHERGIYLSAARSLLFNTVLDRRVRDKSWNKILPGEICMLNGSHSIFPSENETGLQQRLDNFDIHPTGPLWGEGDLPTSANCKMLEIDVIRKFEEFAQGLADARLKQERRSLRLEPRFFQMQVTGDTVSFNFELPPGAYATAVLHELLISNDLDT
ncbi:MAG: tRNA pseudouridine(13) synthase TruD [Gammaproteobacteria bacterium]|nr:tRNA pseudouridine(13) synthase TruD [Gammaproteobacteria bacterium]